MHSYMLIQSQGAPEQLVRAEEVEVLGNHLDVTVAARDLNAGTPHDSTVPSCLVSAAVNPGPENPDCVAVLALPSPASFQT